MKECKYCRESLNDAAKKCKTCGEPFYFTGKILKFTPLFSIVITLFSLSLAYREMKGREKAAMRAEVAQSEARLAVSELHTKEIAANQAISEIARKLPDRTKSEVIDNLRLPPGATLEQIERKARSAPTDPDAQKKAFLYRALKNE